MSDSNKKIAEHEPTEYLGFFEKICKIFSRISAYIFLPALMSVAIFDIIGRKFANVGSTPLQELQWHFFFAAVMLSVAYTYLADGHVRIDVLRNRFSPKLRAWVEILGCLFGLAPLAILLIWAGGDQAWRAFQSGERSAAALGLEHRWIIKSVVPLAGLLLMIAAARVIGRQVKLIQTGKN